MWLPEAIIPCANLLGEGVLWDDASSTLWWTDILSRALYRLSWPSLTPVRLQVPERLGSFGLVADREELIAAFETGIALYHPVLQTMRWLERPAAQPAPWRFNDGRVDRQGRFWTGTMLETDSPLGEACLYSVDSRGAVICRESGLRITNGLATSPDGSRLYLADSSRSLIYAYDLDPHAGSLSNRFIFARSESGVSPDGATVDNDGCLWSAQWGGSCVIRYRPDGRIDRVIKLPVSQPTCLAFGGPHLDLLFVTSARAGLSPKTLALEPHAGDVLVYRPMARGLSEPRYRCDDGYKKSEAVFLNQQ